MATSRIPRGIRNKNPGNIERNSTRWKGMAASQTDSRFLVFKHEIWGIRAMARILLVNYRAGRRSIAEIISRWAPGTENNTKSYIEFVGKTLGVDPYKPCDIPKLLPQLIPAIIRRENGIQPYSEEVIEIGIELEGSV